MCGQPHAASLQVVGPNVSCRRALQVAGLNVARFAGVVQPPVAGSAGVCGQPPAASLQVAGPLVLGFAGASGHLPVASLQVVGPFVQ